MSLFATRRMPILVGLLAALAACSTGQTINDRDLSQLKVAGSPIHTVLFTDDGSNGLAVITPQASGLTGTKENVVMAAGKAWTNEFDLPHPLGLTRDRFVTRLKSQAGIYQFRESPRALDVSHERPDRLREEFGDRGAVLDFRGTYEVVFYAKDPSRYHLVYEARVRLLRLDDWKPLWQSTCRTDIQDTKTAPTLADLRAHDAARLKIWLERGANECSNQLTRNFLSARG